MMEPVRDSARRVYMALGAKLKKIVKKEKPGEADRIEIPVEPEPGLT